MGSANSFSIFALTRSGPGHLLISRPLSFFSMVGASKLIASLLSGKAFSSIFHIFSPSIVKTLPNCDASVSGLSWSASQYTAFLLVFGLYNFVMLTLVFLLLLTYFQNFLELFLTLSQIFFFQDFWWSVA